MSRVWPLSLRTVCAVAAFLISIAFTLSRQMTKGLAGQQLIIESALSAYLTLYALIPLLCLLAVRDARHTTDDAVLLRCGSYRTWLVSVWTRGLLAGATNGTLVAAGAVIAAGTVPSLGTLSAQLVMVSVHAVCGMLLYASAAIVSRLLSPVAGAVTPIAVWLGVLVGWRSDGDRLGLGLLGNPGSIVADPLLAVLLLWPPGVTLLVVILADRRSRTVPWGGALLGYLIIAGASTLLLVATTIGRGSPEYVFESLLAGTEPGVGFGLFLFSVIVHLGYALAATAQWEQHLAGPWTAEAIRCGTVAGWAWRHGRTWVLGAFVVPAALLAIAFGVALGTGTTGPALAVLTPASAYHLLVNGGLQITLYALACLVVRWLSPSEVGGVACLGVLFALCAARLLGVPVPGIATNGLISGTDQWTGALATSVALFVWLSVLLTLFIVVTRRHPNTRSAT